MNYNTISLEKGMHEEAVRVAYQFFRDYKERIMTYEPLELIVRSDDWECAWAIHFTTIRDDVHRSLSQHLQPTDDELWAMWNDKLNIAVSTLDDLRERAANEGLARDFCNALRFFAAHPENIDNLEGYLTRHFASWIARYANSPEGLTSEMMSFATRGVQDND